MSPQPSLRIYLLLAAVIFVWGISWPINKIGIAYITPIWFVALRVSIGAITMFGVVIALKKLIIPTRRDLPIILVIGVLQITLFLLFISLGLVHVNAGRSAILVYTTPLWVMPIAVFVFKEKATGLKWLGFFLGISGVLILFNPTEMDWSNHEGIYGNAILFLASFCWAIAIICTRNMKWHHTPLELISWQLLLAAIPLIMTACIMDPPSRFQINFTLLSCVLFTGTFATAFAYWAVVMISKELPSITVSLSFLAVPVIGLIGSAIFLHEVITPTIFIAMIAILSGVGAVGISEKRLRKKTEIRMD